MEFTKIYHKQLDETLYAGTHKSGLRVFVLPKQYNSTYAIFATDFGSITNRFIPAGKADEVCLPEGIAHFLEHKLFEGKDGNAFEKYAKTGASANAFTSFDTTAYLFSATDQLQENLDILLDFVQNPYFTDENVQKEQGIIAQEIRMYEDDPGWRVFFNMLCALYKSHPVREDIAGTVESIAKINKDLLYECYHSFYHPQNMVLFVAGQAAPELVGDCVEHNLGAKEPIGEVKKVQASEDAAIHKKIIEQKLSVSIPMFHIGFKDPVVGLDGKDLLKKDIVNRILMEIIGGKASRMYQHLYKNGLINDNFYVDQTFEKEYGYSVFAGESVEPKKVQAFITAEIDRLKTEGIDRGEFEKIKKVIYGRYLRTFNSVDRAARYFVSTVFKNIGLFDFAEVYPEIKLEDVQSRLKEHFAMRHMVLSVIYPPDEQE